MAGEIIYGEEVTFTLTGLPEQTVDQADATTEAPTQFGVDTEPVAAGAAENLLIGSAIFGTLAAIAIAGRFYERWTSENPLPHEKQRS